uniref:Helicase with zinc finger 2 n=1 Tax=Microcebus murinus TaxID=30608 RepID=A0A8C5XPG5_MICMU
MAVWEAELRGSLKREDLLVPVAPRGGRTAPLSQPPGAQLYCHACRITCHSREAFENHCSSWEHTHMVALDLAGPWEHRRPPMGLSTFELCPEPARCEYGDVCTKAHSVQELQEWVQRVQAAGLREQAAWQDGLVPYRVRLLAEYQDGGGQALVLAETVEGVSVSCDQPLAHQAREKRTQHSWVFTVRSEDPLLHVALLKQEPGADFSLLAPGLPPGQLYAQGERFRQPGSQTDFRVGVRVQTTSFGTFKQWVAFDFGRRPVLLQELELELGQVHCPGLRGAAVPGSSEELERWHAGNRHVVPGVERTAEQTALLAKYKVPAQALGITGSSPAPGPLSRSNYRQRMHQFLHEEEAAQQRLVAKLSLRAQVSLKTALQTPALGMLFAPPGALYAEVPIPASLTPDTEQGFLLGRAVSTALVAPVPAPDSTVFEARLEPRARSEQALWLLLPAPCCEALGLRPEASPVLEVQFQVDPLTFCLWHQAVDALPEERLVLPDLPACVLPCPRPAPASVRGNCKQKLAMGLIAGSGPPDGRPVSPLLIYGPFGTGKTYTLAMASLQVLQQPHTRVLICTHTNSAADIYVREYFHGHASSGHPEAAPLRVMYADRPPSQTDPTTLRYCCLTQDRRAFRPPTAAELAQHRLVVTTTTQARELGVAAGFFSHILIDEAAQMLECEALTPLRYAAPGTRVVLAGDHMQVAPKLFSVPGARAAEHTLLFRLFLHYQQEAHPAARQSRVVFHENYRSTDAIVRFVSRHFYLAKGSPIQASGNVPRHPRHPPLMFCHVAGRPERDLTRTSWLNPAEIVQVVEKVQEAYDTWPGCWGGREQRFICAVSHGAQVGALRQELRRRNLGEVSVGSFEILPGREFRVVVLSTVHSRDSLQGPGAPTAGFFTDARVLNTVMTRAQSQLVAVGDAVALCSFGACSKLWKSFVRECVQQRSVCPAGLSLEQIEQAVGRGQRAALRAEGAGAAAPSMAVPEGPAGGPAAQCTAAATATAGAGVGDRASCATARGATAEGGPTAVQVAARPAGNAAAAAAPTTEGGECEDTESDFWPCDGELNADDPILQELLDESRKVTVTVGEDGLLQTVARPAGPRQAWRYENLPLAALHRLLAREPALHRRCAFLPETFDRASAVPLDGGASGAIQLRGRRNCGMAFAGDEVLVKVLPGAAGDGGAAERPQGRVVGVLKRRRQDLAFVCRVDEWDPRIMVPINSSVTKIFVAELKDPLQVPLYCLHQGRVQRVGQERLTPEARRGRLFWVRVVLWRTRFYYPLGVVLEVLPEATSWDRALRVLDLEYGLRAPSPDPAAVARALQKHRAELGRAGGQREDCRRFLTFTVDPQGACNLDDALSVRDLGPQYEVAVHIADVASLLPRDGPLDVEARRRGTAFYAPGREPVPMLPAGLCRDALSLLPGQDRAALSLFLTVEKGSGQLGGWRFGPSVVCSDRQLSYEEAERAIREHPGVPAQLDSVDACLVAAFHLSRELRRRRLQGACLYEQMDEDSALGFRAAHLMVKEYMIQFNSLAAEFLAGSERTRAVTPLRRQPAPSSHQLEAVSQKHGPLVPLSLHLRHHLRAGGRPAPRLQLLASLWKQVQLAACGGDYEQMADLIATDDVHPSLAPAGLDLRKALGRSVFGRSGQGAQAGHYTLQVDRYTWATSPIRRYLDVVLQRQILLALGHGGAAYSARDVDRLCLDFGQQHAQAQGYQRRARGLHLAVQLKAQPRHKLGFAVDVEGGSRCFTLLFPTLRETLPDPCPVHYRSLQLVEPPRDLGGQQGLRLQWRRRVYSVQGSDASSPKPGALRSPHTQTVSAALWERLLALVEAQCWPEAAALVGEQEGEQAPGRELVQVRRSRCGHFLEVAQELGSGHTLQVQLGASLQRGFLLPTLQLWEVAPGLSLCLEHVERPADCFLGHPHQAPRDRYRDADAYARVWEPFCALESVTNAVAENSSITLQHLRVSWDAERTPQGQLQGTFCLETSFLSDNSIDVDLGYCYLCIRLEGLCAPPGPPAPGPSGLGPLLSVDPSTYTWVAHGLTESGDQEGWADREEAPRQVHFFIRHMAMEEVPEDVLRPGTLFTVEVLPKLLPDLRKEEALRRLAMASPLVTSIALGRPVPQPDTCAGQHPSPEQVPGATGPSTSRRPHKLNPSQNAAIREPSRNALRSSGYGKTVVGLHITTVPQSTRRPGQPSSSPGGGGAPGGACILTRGPSNKSCGCRKAELSPPRVRRSRLEVTGLPVPPSPVSPWPGGALSVLLPCRWALRGPLHRNPLPLVYVCHFTLHHRIRKAPTHDAAAIRAFDARWQKGEVFSREDLDSYKRVLRKARKFELDQHQVILCTCSCAAAPGLRNLDVRQILVDEAAMATEPETLIPLVHFPQAQKVVLLGDHKQLRPVVRNERLQNLGLDRSLFERYHRDAYMLDTQYRMHDGICAFPSAEFYQGKLKTCQGLRRPPSVLGHAGKESCPVIFGHVQGREQSLLVSTDEGNENSKANMEEVAVVVSVNKQLTLGRTVEPKDVASLTPYNAPAPRRSARASCGRVCAGMTVSSITEPGEWRYVLVSTVRTCGRSDLDQQPTKAWLRKFLGFVVDPNQVNVAITRAQEGLCLIGDHLLLRCCPLWQRLLDFCEARQSLVPARQVRVRRRPALSS